MEEVEQNVLRDPQAVGDESVRAYIARLIGEYGDGTTLEIAEDGVDTRRNLSCSRLVDRTLDRPGFDTSLVESVQPRVGANKVCSARAGHKIISVNDSCVAGVRVIELESNGHTVYNEPFNVVGKYGGIRRTQQTPVSAKRDELRHPPSNNRGRTRYPSIVAFRVREHA